LRRSYLVDIVLTFALVLHFFEGVSSVASEIRLHHFWLNDYYIFLLMDGT